MGSRRWEVGGGKSEVGGRRSDRGGKSEVAGSLKYQSKGYASVKRSQLKPPARARSARARLYAIVDACCLDPRGALATLALIFVEVFALLLSLSLLLSLLSPCLQCLHALKKKKNALPVP